VFEAGNGLLFVSLGWEPGEFDEEGMQERRITEAFGVETAPEGSCLVSVILEGRSPETLAMQGAVLSMLQAKCGGVVTPN
jgi:hypothetical protein